MLKKIKGNVKKFVCVKIHIKDKFFVHQILICRAYWYEEKMNVLNVKKVT